MMVDILIFVDKKARGAGLTLSHNISSCKTVGEVSQVSKSNYTLFSFISFQTQNSPK